jgi:hypothetical protein
MSLPPLSHHEILGLVEPFTRHGRRVDLEASNRLERRLVFRPVEHTLDPRTALAFRENLELEKPYSGTFRLTRTLTLTSGLKATLVAEGREPGPLLALVETVPPASQFASGPGYVIARSHLVDPAQLVMTEAVAKVGELTLVMKMPTVRGYPADLTLTPAPGERFELPEDLLAVIGWDWAPLRRSGDGWTSKLRVRGKGAVRSGRGEAKLVLMVKHLAQTLAEPPRRFHERLVGARWGAAVRRAIPILTSVGLIAGVSLLPLQAVEEYPFLRLVLMNAPLLVIGLSFTLQESARVEIPPMPRRSTAASWRTSPPPLPAPPRPLDVQPG